MKDIDTKIVGKEQGQFYHIGGAGEGEAGPFDTFEAAVADAEQYLHNSRWGVNEVIILKAVAVSRTETVHTTTWDRT
jgi:hypothetical protein